MGSPIQAPTGACGCGPAALPKMPMPMPGEQATAATPIAPPGGPTSVDTSTPAAAIAGLKRIVSNREGYLTQVEAAIERDAAANGGTRNTVAETRLRMERGTASMLAGLTNVLEQHQQYMTPRHGEIAVAIAQDALRNGTPNPVAVSRLVAEVYQAAGKATPQAVEAIAVSMNLIGKRQASISQEAVRLAQDAVRTGTPNTTQMQALLAEADNAATASTAVRRLLDVGTLIAPAHVDMIRKAEMEVVATGDLSKLTTTIDAIVNQLRPGTTAAAS